MVLTAALVLVLARLAWIDMCEHRLPDHYTISLLVAGLAWNAGLEGGLPEEALFGAILGFLLFWALGAAFYRMRRVDGLGLGDAKLFAAAGAWLGVTRLPIVLFVAATAALAYVIASRHDRKAPLAFGPWLALGFLAAWAIIL